MRDASIWEAWRLETALTRLASSRRPGAATLGWMLDYEVSVSEAASLLKDNKARLIDVREPWEFAAAHIPGSLLMPMGDVPARAHQELDPDEHLVILCHHGQRSLNVTAWLRDQGFEQAQSLRGGIDAWASLIDPSVGRY